MGKLKEAADEFEIKGRAKILGQTEPQWGLFDSCAGSGREDNPPDTLPEITVYFRCFNYQNNDALRAKDAGGLLDFREWREFDSAGFTR